ncbi:MAG: Ig-like domain-containing protein [Enterococcus casseliflavus]|nr:Ig-like domain-containing protein [Enterococcus casseliflavus]
MRLTLDNLNTVGGRFGELYAAFSYDNFGHITARNVTHRGGEYILAEGGVTLGSDVDVQITDKQNASNSISVWGTKSGIGQGGPFIVEENANVSISQETGTIYYGSMILDTATEFTIGENANMTLKTTGDTSMGGVSMIWSHSTLKATVKSGASLTIQSDIPNLQGIRSNFREISVEHGGNLDIQTNGAPGIYSTSQLNLNLEGTFSLINNSNLNNTAANTIYAPNGSNVNWNGNNIVARNKGTIFDDGFNFNWSNVSGTTNISGFNSVNNITTNSLFNSEFSLQSFNGIKSEERNIAETTISEVTTDSTSVTGTAEPNAEITIKAGDTVIANGRVGKDGIYSLTIEKQPAGTVVTAQATLNGISSNIAETIVERATIAETTLNEVTTTDTTVSGTAEPNAQVEITIGDETKNATVDSEGNFAVEIDPQVAGTIITAQASIDGLQSNIASTIVVNDPANTEGTITPDTYNISSGEQFLRGTYTGDVASARVYVNGSSVRGGNFADGSFEFFIGNRIQSVDDVVEIEALDQYGKVLDRTTVELTRDLAGTITPDQYRVGETMITGTFTGDVNFARLVINGTPSNAWGGTFNADGTFSFYVANLGIKAGDKVEIQALNRQFNGNTEAIEVLETKEVTVIDQLQGTITPDKYNYTDTTITGTFTGDINFANLVIDGQSVGNWGGTFNKETGRFEFFVHAQFRDQIRTAAKVELQTYHRETVDGQTIDHKLVLQPVEIVRATGTIQPAAFKVTESEITGTFTGNVNFANLIVDGRSVSWGGTFNTTDQTFTYFVNQDTRNLIRDAKTVELVAYHREVVNGRPVDTELDRSVVTIDKEFTGTITPNPYKLGERTITGTYTGDDINFGRLEIDGMILWVSGFADGTFTAYLNQEQANRVTKDSQMTIHALHRFADLSTREIAQATVSITE